MIASSQNADTPITGVELRRYVIKYVATLGLLTAIQMAIFFGLAGRVDIPRAWIYLGLFIVHSLFSLAVLYRFSPQLLGQRTKMRREGSKAWDEVLMRVNNIMAMFVVP